MMPISGNEPNLTPTISSFWERSVHLLPMLYGHELALVDIFLASFMAPGWMMFMECMCVFVKLLTGVQASLCGLSRYEVYVLPKPSWCSSD